MSWNGCAGPKRNRPFAWPYSTLTVADAADAVLRASIVTTRDLAATLAISPQAALGLLRQLTEAGLVREATNQKS